MIELICVFPFQFMEKRWNTHIYLPYIVLKDLSIIVLLWHQNSKVWWYQCKVNVDSVKVQPKLSIGTVRQPRLNRSNFPKLELQLDKNDLINHFWWNITLEKNNSMCFEMKFVRHEIYLNTQHIKNMASTV